MALAPTRPIIDYMTENVRGEECVNALKKVKLVQDFTQRKLLHIQGFTRFYRTPAFIAKFDNGVYEPINARDAMWRYGTDVNLFYAAHGQPIPTEILKFPTQDIFKVTPMTNPKAANSARFGRGSVPGEGIVNGVPVVQVNSSNDRQDGRTAKMPRLELTPSAISTLKEGLYDMDEAQLVEWKIKLTNGLDFESESTTDQAIPTFGSNYKPAAAEATSAQDAAVVACFAVAAQQSEDKTSSPRQEIETISLPDSEVEILQEIIHTSRAEKVHSPSINSDDVRIIEPCGNSPESSSDADDSLIGDAGRPEGVLKSNEGKGKGDMILYGDFLDADILDLTCEDDIEWDKIWSMPSGIFKNKTGHFNNLKDVC